MKGGRLGVALVIAMIAFACDTTDPGPSWVGTYTVLADTVRYCTENLTPAGRTCDCTAPGHLEGTLELLADTEGKPTGELSLRECPPGGPCGSDVTYPVIPHTGPPNPNPPAGDRLSFCAGHCPFAGDDDGIQFIDALVPANPLTGHFWRADGNVRSCGSDSGPFTATRQ
jgi:hypothetical protein